MPTLDPGNSRGPRGLGIAQTLVTGWAGVSETSRATPSISFTTTPFTPSGWPHVMPLHPPKGERASSFNKGCLSTVAKACCRAHQTPVCLGKNKQRGAGPQIPSLSGLTN